eukprot:TRINITY_DN20248_c0_g2_i4.p2 TRINITY_DN20248_c0_g2~~TRINITY_DN20248_c0_g2_i4.p2  ORF type:complete len:211 (+),score=26.81 TRINITY_DN20248_c0_g2_i4:105-737(+)
MPPVFGRVAGGGVRRMEVRGAQRAAPYDNSRPTGRQGGAGKGAPAGGKQFHRAPDRRVKGDSTPPPAARSTSTSHKTPKGAPRPLAFVKSMDGQIVETAKDPTTPPTPAAPRRALDHRSLEAQLLRTAASTANAGQRERNVKDFFMKIPHPTAPAEEGRGAARDEERGRRRRHITPESDNTNPLPEGWVPHATGITLSDRVATMSTEALW